MSHKNPLQQIASIEHAFDNIVSAMTSGDEEEDEKYETEDLQKKLAETCQVVRTALVACSDNLEDIVKAAEASLDRMVMNASAADAFDFVESFAHASEADLVKDPEAGNHQLSGMLESLLSFLSGRDSTMAARLAEGRNDPQFRTKSYEETPRLHANSSRIARFRTENVSVTNATPLAQAVFQARLSATNIRTSNPIQFILPPGSSTMSLLQMGGWKDRDPVLAYYDLASCPDWDDIPNETEVSVGLSSVAFHGALDPTRKLLYIADDQRIKSYQYGLDGTHEEHVAKHTLRSSGKGPLALLNDGAKLLRAGKGVIDVWDIDAQPTHGDSGDRRIGKGKVSTEDSWREDDGAEIEISTGSKPTSTIQVQDRLQISDWIAAPSGVSGHMLVNPDASMDSQRLWAVDINTGGVPITRYLGHSGAITQISTSPADDPNSFLTASRDGIARIYDVREPLPKLVFDVGGSSEPVTSALYVHVEGIPVVFAGCTKSESIKMWDPRARAMVYELATGNNGVASLAWDAPRSTLYAATECNYMDRMGNHYDYRPAKIPGSRRGIPPEKKSKMVGEGDDGDDEEWEDEDEDEDEDYDGDEFWPSKASHKETHFGYAFDSGEHRLFRYKFGVESDPAAIPAYGNGGPSGLGYW